MKKRPLQVLGISKKPDGLGRIRTGDLRRVKAEDLAISAPFSDVESDGDMTPEKPKPRHGWSDRFLWVVLRVLRTCVVSVLLDSYSLLSRGGLKLDLDGSDTKSITTVSAFGCNID